jgi:hypothetical protein
VCEIKANANFHGHELTDIPVINPGDWFGKTWLIEIGGSYSSFYLIVEAGSMSDAIDELADSEKYGHHIVVEDDNLDDYDPDTCNYGPSGQVIDLDHLMIYGAEGTDCPFLCRYFGDDLPNEGMSPTEFHCREEV